MKKCSIFLTLLIAILPYTFSNYEEINSLISRGLSAVGQVIVETKNAISKTINPNKSYYPQEMLTSRFSSWAISPQVTSSNINLDKVWKIFKKKKDIIVAIIDTGIDKTHPFLASNIHILTGRAIGGNYGIDFSLGPKKISKTPYDKHGHGTHVAGIVKSVSPEVKILALKYYNPQASGQENLNSAIRALEYAINANVDIINYSGGGPEPSTDELRVLKIAERKDILIVAAAGNEKQNIDQSRNAYYPASYGLKNIITVSSHDRNNKLLASSNWGKKSVDISAPGHDIKSAYPNNRASRMTGTSQATAFVTGVAALLKANFPDLSNHQIKQAIITAAKREVDLTYKSVSGGRLDAYSSFQAGQLIHLAGAEENMQKKRSIAQIKKKFSTTKNNLKRVPLQISTKK